MVPQNKAGKITQRRYVFWGNISGVLSFPLPLSSCQGLLKRLKAHSEHFCKFHECPFVWQVSILYSGNWENRYQLIPSFFSSFFFPFSFSISVSPLLCKFCSLPKSREEQVSWSSCLTRSRVEFVFQCSRKTLCFRGNGKNFSVEKSHSVEDGKANVKLK